MSYGPTRSPLGRNPALDQLAQSIAAGETPVNRATAEAVQASVADDRKVSVEEASTLKGIEDSIRTRAHPGDTPVGKALLGRYAHVAGARLTAHQINTSVNPAHRAMEAWMRVASFGMFGAPLPSYVGTSQRPGGLDSTRPVRDQAIDGVLKDLAGRSKLEKIVEKFPAAVEKPGNSHNWSQLKPEVEAKYQQIVADFKAGKGDEHDVLGPMKSFLAAKYAG